MGLHFPHDRIERPEGACPFERVSIRDSSRISAICSARGLPLHGFAWRPAIARAGLKRNAAYLVRPDGYVALADPEASAARLQAYLDERGVIAAAPSVTVGGPARRV